MQQELTLERMIHAGKCLARLKDGQLALVRGGLPHEHVIAEISPKKGVLQGYVKEVLDASPDRIKANKHPGLDYSFISYEKQLELKRDVVKDALSRSLKRELEVTLTKSSPQTWAYRNTVQPVITKEGLGYRKPESHDLVFLDHDPVANEAINKAWQAIGNKARPKGIREIVFRGNDEGEVLISLIASASARNYLDYAHKLIDKTIKGVSYAPYDARGRFRRGSEKLTGQKTLRQHYGRFEISISASSFAQPNPSAASLLYKNLSKLLPNGQHALDLYAGSGIIGMHLAEKFDDVTALEIDGSSIAKGKLDAERLGIHNLKFVKSDAKNLVLPENLDLITVDPPRSGLNKEVRQLISNSNSAKLIYVSCDVATWARDIAIFEQNGWTLTHHQPYDFYPQTHHIEILSMLER